MSVCALSEEECRNLHLILHLTHTSHVHSCSQSVSLCHSLLSTLDDPSNALALAQVASLKRHVTPSAHHIHPTRSQPVICKVNMEWKLELNL